VHFRRIGVASSFLRGRPGSTPHPPLQERRQPRWKVGSAHEHGVSYAAEPDTAGWSSGTAEPAVLLHGRQQVLLCSSELITPAVLDDGIASSDIRLSFTKKDGKPGRNLEVTRHEFVSLGIPAAVLGQLRIHMIIPGTSDKGLLKTRVVDDVLVFIHQGNLDDFFWEGIAGVVHADLMRGIKDVIRSTLL
jgi:hypothetical protein